MIHAYLFVVDGNRERESHGPKFHEHMYRINRLTGANITVSFIVNQHSIFNTLPVCYSCSHLIVFYGKFRFTIHSMMKSIISKLIGGNAMVLVNTDHHFTAL